VEEELIAKLKHYEQLLRSRGGDVDAALEDMKEKSSTGVMTTEPHKKKASAAKPAQGCMVGKPENTVIVWEFRNGRMIAEKDGWTYVEEFFWAPGISEEVRLKLSSRLTFLKEPVSQFALRSHCQWREPAFRLLSYIPVSQRPSSRGTHKIMANLHRCRQFSHETCP